MQATSLFDDLPRSSTYGLGPDTRTLCSDLTWRPIGSLATGDKLIAYDEHPDAGRRRRMALSTVIACERIRCPGYRIGFSGGREIIASENHLWLSGHSDARWIPTRNHRAGREVRDFGLPWITDTSWDSGWLAGAFDGEASLSSRGTWGQGWFIVFPQLPGAVMDLADQLTKRLGYETRWKTTCGTAGVIRLAITGMYDCFRFLGECRPVRLLAKSGPWIEAGSCARSRGTARQRRYNAFIESIEYAGEQDLVAIETSTRTLYAEGLYGHSSSPERA